MEHTANTRRECLDGLAAFQLLFCAGLAFFWVIFLWNFLEHGVYALGINASVFFFLFFGLFIWMLCTTGKYVPRDLTWIVPITVLIISFALYDNPFLKTISLLVLPLLFAVYYNYAVLDDKIVKNWNGEFLTNIFGRLILVFWQLHTSAASYIHVLVPTEKTSRHVAIRIAIGVVMLAVLLFTVFIPLLSSADAAFSAMTRVIQDWMMNILSMPIVYRIVAFFFLSMFFLSVVMAWSRPFAYKNEHEQLRSIDSIISGIVIGGIFGIYLLFLWVQIHRLWVGALPFDFKETEHLVKSGFWQLLFLSVINVGIYFFSYRRTTLFVQKLLAVFTIASLLLLISAGHRMGLYVVYHGFSYEKFYASYTVIYCVLLFVWLISQLFRSQQSNIVKFLITLFLWMFAVVSVLPIEQFIFRANVALFKIEGSRINLWEMQMLSPDVLTIGKRYNQNGFLVELEDQSDWQQWIQEQERVVLEKSWYERNVMNMVYLYKI